MGGEQVAQPGLRPGASRPCTDTPRLTACASQVLRFILQIEGETHLQQEDSNSLSQRSEAERQGFEVCPA